MPMMRNVHLRKIEKKKIAKLQEDWIRTSLAFIGLGKAAERLTCTTREYIEMTNNYVMGIDLSDCADFTAGISDRYYPIYGQPVLDQKAVVKIVTSGEEN
jgi:hypothetical protein